MEDAPQGRWCIYRQSTVGAGQCGSGSYVSDVLFPVMPVCGGVGMRLELTVCLTLSMS